MESERIREMTDEELREELGRTREELFRLKFRATYEELENPSLLRSLRRDVARLKTIERERALASATDRRVGS